MNLVILTPEITVFSGEAKSVSLPGESGRFQVLENHAALIAALKEGEVKVETANDKNTYTIKSGIVEVLNNKVSVLTEGIVA
ncbi:MAG: ATP synthase F1 subunit epsilon [Chitinophagales bacterium]|nr:ATP synthase F1 subunit epsilon [Chitinophagales bacterium]